MVLQPKTHFQFQHSIISNKEAQSKEFTNLKGKNFSETQIKQTNPLKIHPPKHQKHPIEVENQQKRQQKDEKFKGYI